MKEKHLFSHAVGRTIWAAVAICTALLVSGCALLYVDGDTFRRATVSGRLQVGASADEARTILGEPESVASRKTVSDVRSVWTYRDRNFSRSRIPAYILLGPITVGIIWLTPWSVTDTVHQLVLSDDEVVGFDLADPYAPDLIIEHRER